MIGHFLLTLTPAQEDRVLTERLAIHPESEDNPGGGYYVSEDGRCLVGAAFDAIRAAGDELFLDEPRCADKCTRGAIIEEAFDSLVLRFGAPRVNTAIRSRILSNRARRVLLGNAVDASVVGVAAERPDA